MTLFQTAVIVDQNGGKCGKDKSWKWGALFFLQERSGRIEKSRRRRPQMSLVLNRRVLNLVCLLFDCLFPTEHHSSSSSSFLPSVSFRIHLCCTLKSMTHRAPPNCLLSEPLHSFSNTEHHYPGPRGFSFFFILLVSIGWYFYKHANKYDWSVWLAIPRGRWGYLLLHLLCAYLPEKYCSS